jgi:hypothetical protein
MVVLKDLDSFTIKVEEPQYISIYKPRQIPMPDGSKSGKAIFELSFPFELVPINIKAHHLWLHHDRPLARAISHTKVPVIGDSSKLKYMNEFAELHNIEMDMILSLCDMEIQITPIARDLAMMGRSLGLYLDAISITNFPTPTKVLSKAVALRKERNKFRDLVA